MNTTSRYRAGGESSNMVNVHQYLVGRNDPATRTGATISLPPSSPSSLIHIRTAERWNALGGECC